MNGDVRLHDTREKLGMAMGATALATTMLFAIGQFMPLWITVLCAAVGSVALYVLHHRLSMTIFRMIVTPPDDHGASDRVQRN